MSGYPNACWRHVNSVSPYYKEVCNEIIGKLSDDELHVLGATLWAAVREERKAEETTILGQILRSRGELPPNPRMASWLAETILDTLEIRDLERLEVV